jgi:hypothetical protein
VGALASALASQLEKTKKSKAEKKREVYQKMINVEERDVNQLMSLDKEIERLFEIQMKKSVKNEEMMHNKIKDLNEKPSLRNYLFKKFSLAEIEKDLVTMRKTIKNAIQIK